MKREVKFRAWDNITKCMYQVKCLEFLADKSLFDIRLVVPVQTSEDDIDFDFPVRRDGEYSLMQYTGLKDKNGKEIYEGDVWLMNGIKSQPMIVCFDNGKFISKSTWGEYIKRDDGYTYWDYIDGEVIGNIYENSELLNQ